MGKELCLGCMNYHEEGQPCPCGYDPQKEEHDVHHLNPGVVLHNRYQVGKVLGEGGFGITYVGRDNVLDLKVAIKEFYMAGYVSRNTTYSYQVDVSMGGYRELFTGNREKFLTEARTLAKFANEDGIVGIRDFFQENNTAYIIMDFLEGETLKEHLTKNGVFSWEETMRIFEPLLKSLDVVHKNGLIHRDISPDNIMILPDGKVKLLDFGAAREIDKKDLRSMSMVLKPGYAPVEQYRMNGKQGPWTDVYAICATMYCCITGEVPGDSMDRVFEDTLKPACELVTDCPKQLSDALTKGMAVRQEDRYQSVSELYKAIYLKAKEVKKPEPAEDDRTVFAGRIPEKRNAEPVKETPKAVQLNNLTMPAIEPEPISEAPVLEKAPEPKLQEVKPSEVKKVESAPVKEKKEKALFSKKENKPEKVVEAPVKAVESTNTVPPMTDQATEEITKQKKLNIKIFGIAAVVICLLIGVFSITKNLGNRRTKPEENDPAYAGQVFLYGDPEDYGGQKTYNEIRTDLPDDLYPVVAVLDGTEMKFPVSYSDFVAINWEAAEPANLKTYLKPGESQNVILLNMETGSQVNAKFINSGRSVVQVKDAMIYDFWTRTGAFNTEENSLRVGDVELGKTTQKEFEKSYQGYYTKDSSYSIGEYENKVYYYFGFGDTKICDYLSIKNDAYQWQTTEVKSELLGFEQNQKQLDELLDSVRPKYVLELTREGKTWEFAAGAPLKVFLDEGFILEDSVESLRSGEKITGLTLKLDGRTSLDISLMNPSMYAADASACIVNFVELKSSQLLKEDEVKLYVVSSGKELSPLDINGKFTALEGTEAEELNHYGDFQSYCTQTLKDGYQELLTSLNQE